MGEREGEIENEVFEVYLGIKLGSIQNPNRH